MIDFDIQQDVRCDVDLLVKITPIGREAVGEESSLYVKATVEDLAEFIKRLCPADNLKLLESALQEAYSNPLL